MSDFPASKISEAVVDATNEDCLNCRNEAVEEANGNSRDQDWQMRPSGEGEQMLPARSCLVFIRSDLAFLCHERIDCSTRPLRQISPGRLDGHRNSCSAVEVQSFCELSMISKFAPTPDDDILSHMRISLARATVADTAQ